METDDGNKLAAYIRDKGYCRIGVDGINGAGKSTLAAALASILGKKHLNLDNYLVKNQGGFLAYLKYDELKQKTLELDCFVIEGVCLLKVLEEIQAPVDCLVYVKRMRHGCWDDENLCELGEDLDEYIKKFKKNACLFKPSKTDTPGLAEEVIRYHYKYKPHQKAEFFYTRENC